MALFQDESLRGKYKSSLRGYQTKLVNLTRDQLPSREVARQQVVNNSLPNYAELYHLAKVREIYCFEKMVTNVFLENSIYFIYLNINENSREPNKCTRAFIGKYLGVFCLKSPPPHRLLKESFSNFSIKEKNFGVKYFWGVKGGGWRGLQNRNKQKNRTVQFYFVRRNTRVPRKHRLITIEIL